MRTGHRVGSVLLCIVLVTAFLGCASTPKQKSTGEYIDDSVITAKVKTAIAQDPSVSAFQINVTTYKGVVQLSGFVDTAQAKSRAGEVAAGVEGVKSVKNDLAVK